ncbi:MAG: GNAT family N-acetyltransferase [Acidocella sp. 20-57-95]|nr:MAG: GNAT family N-acetyltransferase [Acidocella sp. 20-57-95]OYV62006.1 MAG: GNAT family N-acetyltransferase [Acidocella sp. 21-58-7]
MTARHLVTARLVMSPVGGADLRDLVGLKADPLAFAQMLGGVRSAHRTAEELAEDIQAWGEFGFGMWAVRARSGGRFCGVTGLMHRPDGRGVALRFAFRPEARGVGLASEAAHAALVYAHEVAGLTRVIAVAREENFSSRTVLGAIGMAEADRFMRHGILLLIYQSVRQG